MNYVKLLVGLLCFFSPCNISAQKMKYRPDTSWKVYAYGKEKRIAFSGGFNNPQFSMADLNNDGTEDLIVFEKGSLQIKTFLNYGIAGHPDYRYRPEYANNFPVENGVRAVNGYMKIENLNCDNVPDLITRGTSGFSIYYGYYKERALHFRFYKKLFYSPLTATKESFESPSFPTNGWKVINTNDKGWKRVTQSTSPFVLPKEGTAMVMFEAGSMAPGSTASLVSRAVRVSPNLKSEGKISLWIYRDNAPGGDSLSILINDSDMPANKAYYLGGIARNRSVHLPRTESSDGWYQYSFPIPFSITGDKLYFIFQATSRRGNNILLDEIHYITSNVFGDVSAYVDPGGDIPGIADVDGDGDMDFLSFNVTGGFVSFYKNYQKEENLPCDSIHINLKDACWGKVFQGATVQQTLGIECSAYQPVTPPAKITHTGNTICLFDHDGDGDIDYLNGHVAYSGIQLLKNGRVEYNHERDSIIEQDTSWQSAGHIYRTMQFPAAFYIDIDQDGKKDILISPSAENASENYHNVAFYKNTGTALSPAFTYQHDTLLVEETIDVGTGSYPMLYDYNKDGKPDLFVGCEGFFQSDGSLRARIAHYQNTSTESNSTFTLQNNNFLDIDSLNVRGAYPAVGDLDNDGLDDLIIGHVDGTISFYKNMASSNNEQPVWQLTQTTIKDVSNNVIDSNKYAAPFIYDIDKDGRKDLIIGGQSGWVYFYKNTGASGQLSLQYQTGKLGAVRADSWNAFSGFSAPYIGQSDNDKEFLITGSHSGRISRYTGFETGNTSGVFLETDSAYHEINLTLGKYAGFRSVPAFGDLDGDGIKEMVLGNILGGLLIFKLRDVSSEDIDGKKNTVKIYPNPTRNRVFIEWDESFPQAEQVTIRFINTAGQAVFHDRFNAADITATIDIAQLSSGVYLCQVTSGANHVVQKFVVIR